MEDEEASEPLRGRGVPFVILGGAGTGGSSGLWMVLARFAGGGARMEAYRLWTAFAEGLSRGRVLEEGMAVGGAMVPLRWAPELPAMGVIALFPCVAGLS